MGDLIRLRRPGAPLTQPKAKVKPRRSPIHAMQAGPDSVTVFVGRAEIWWSADDADDFADELKRFAKAARELSNPKAE